LEHIEIRSSAQSRLAKTHTHRHAANNVVMALTDIMTP